MKTRRIRQSTDVLRVSYSPSVGTDRKRKIRSDTK